MATNRYAALATQAARRYGLNPSIFRGLVSAESSWNPNAVSPAGAVGLTQLMPATARALGVANPRNPSQNLMGGARYLAEQLHAFGGDYSKALAAYNAGPNAVRKYGGIPPYAETQAYVKKILGSSKSGGPSSADPGAVSAAAPGSPYPAKLPAIDANKLYGILNAQTQRVLAGKMPSANYQSQLQNLVSDALSNSRLTATARGVGNAIAATGGSLSGATAGALAVQAGQAIVSKQVPYSWGGGNTSGPTKGIAQGANTTGFDCSSFAQYIWAKAGVKIPRTTYEQIHTGHAVPSLSQAQPGDLLFPSTGHVQIYVGGGHVIEEPHTGGHAQVAPVRSSYIAIRRPG